MTRMFYLRSPTRQRVGVIYLEPSPSHTLVKVGWSICREGDRWDNNLGKKIALGRLQDRPLANALGFPIFQKHILPNRRDIDWTTANRLFTYLSRQLLGAA